MEKETKPTLGGARYTDGSPVIFGPFGGDQELESERRIRLALETRRGNSRRRWSLRTLFKAPDLAVASGELPARRLRRTGTVAPPEPAPSLTSLSDAADTTPGAGALYHLARPEDVEQLLQDGFSSPSGIQSWAAGVYLATDEQTARLYESLDHERVRLLVEADVQRPFVVRAKAPQSDPFQIRFDDQFTALERAFANAFGMEAAERIDRRRLQSERRSLAERVTDTLSYRGYDSLRVEMGDVSPDDQRAVRLGGNQLIVFDPSQARVLGLAHELEPVVPLDAPGL